jgi:hypothetical protein
MDRCPTCHRCAGCPDERVRNTGRGLATAVVLTLDELEDLVFATSDLFVRERFLCAIALHDVEREKRIRAEMITP